MITARDAVAIFASEVSGFSGFSSYDHDVLTSNPQGERCVMEFVRKTFIGFVLVFGGLFTVHSLGEQAIRAFAPNQSPTAKTGDTTYAPEQIAAKRWVIGKAEVPELGPEAKTAHSPAAVNPAAASISNATAEGDV